MTHKSIRKIYLILAISLAAIMLLTPVLGSLDAAQANAENFLLNSTIFGPNEDISISLGNLTFACDDIYPVSDIYIVPRGTAVGNADLKSLDPSGLPNTLFGASGGIIAGDLIGITAPSGQIGAGEWDVVEDVCQDGYLSPSDTVLSPGFTVIIDVDVPPLPAFESLKSHAAEQRDYYYDKAWGMAHLLAAYTALDVMSAVRDPRDTILWMTTFLAGPLSGEDPGQVAIKLLFDLSSYYQGIAADPPDPDFQQLSPLGERPVLDPLDSEPLSVAAMQVGTAAGSEAELMRALLASLERYQGAELEGNGDWALIHARAVQNYADIAADHLLESNEALAALEAALIADNRDLDSLTADILAFQSRVATDGFTADEIREAANLGLSEADLLAMRDEFLDIPYTFNKAGYLALINDIQAVNTELMTDLNTLSADMAPIITALESDPLVGDRAPLAEAGGVYSGTTGAAVTLDASGSMNANPEAEYAWDLDGDGEFDDASGVTAVFTYTRPFTGLAGLKVTNSGAFANIDYAPISIAPANSRPVITAFSPAERRVDITLGSSQTFSMTAADPDNDPLMIEWQVDGAPVSGGSAFTFTPGVADIGLHWINARVGEAGPFHTPPVNHFWVVRVTAVDSDGDGWNANADCDDDADTVHPGAAEITGNGIDDDCDVTTSDVPPVPAFSFTPEMPLTDETIHFTDASTDADGSLVAWEWNFGDGVTTTLQHPAHSYAAAGSYTVTLQVRDNDGGIEQAGQTITVYEQLGEAGFITSNSLNVAREADGAVVAAVSSEVNSNGYRAHEALDDNTVSYWSTAANQVTDQWILVDLAGSEPHLVSQVTLMGQGTTFGARNYELFLSETGTDEADFTSVLTGTVPKNDRLNIFNFAPTWARYAKLYLYDNWGSAQYIRLAVFQLNERPREGGIVSLADGGPAAVVVDYSGHYSTQDPTKALDSVLSSSWRPAFGAADGAWMKIELSGEMVAVDRIRLASTVARIKDFEVRVSDTTADDLAFTTVYSGTAANSDGLQEFSFPAVNAKYVYLIIHNTYTTSFLSVGMVQVLAEDGVNLAGLTPLNAIVAAYSSYDYYLPNYAIDYETGGTSLRWRSGGGQTTNQWIKVRLAQGGSYPINRVYIDGYGTNSSPKDFEVRVSNASLDDADFTTVLSGTLPADGSGRYFTFPPVQARYVQIYLHNNHGNPVNIELANFRVYAVDRGGSTVPFLDTSENQETIIGWLWDFGDGSTSTEQHPTHTYTSPGTYSVTLTIESLLQTASKTMPYTVYGGAEAHFDLPLNPKEGASTNFTDNSTLAPETKLLAWTWDFGYEILNGQNRATIFPDNGDWPVSLTVVDSNLIQTTYSRTVPVANVAPSVNAGSSQSILVFNEWGPQSHYISDASGADLASLTCEWDLGDGRTAEILNCTNAELSAVTFSYAVAGVYNATLTVTDKDGGVTSDTIVLTVSKRTSRLTILNVDSIDAGTAEVKLALTDNDGGQTTSGKEVTLSWAGGTVTLMTNELGVATTRLPISSGQAVTLTAVFQEDDSHYGSSDTFQTIVSSSPSDFWLAFPSNAGNHNVTPSIFVAGVEDTTGFVTVPALDFIAPFTITGGTAIQVVLPVETLLPKATVTTTTGVYVTAADPVQVYGLSQRPYSTDAFLGISVENLGREYFAMSYKNSFYNNGTGPNLAVVGTQHGTTVQISPTSGSVYTVTLNEGQVHQLAVKDDLTGSYIEASAPVAVFSGHDCAFVPDAAYIACDHLVEQMLPASAWGWNHVTMPLAGRQNGDTFRILAAQDGTNVYLNGALIATLDQGQFHQQLISGPAHITADKPILVAQYSNGGQFDGVVADPFMMLIPPVEQFGPYYPGISTPPSGIETNYLNIVAPIAAVGSITVDGSVITPTDFVAIGSSGYAGVQIAVNAGSHELDGSLPFGVFAYGFDVWDSYGYPGGGFRLSDIALIDSITLSPTTASLSLGETHCVTAVLADAAGGPITGVRVDLTRSGAHPAQEFAYTDENGEAIFCYVGTVEGSDTMTAVVGVFSATATAGWLGNLDPEATDDSVTTSEDTAVTLDVLANDSDPDGDPLTVITVTQPANGLVNINPDGSLTYNPDADYNSSDSAGLADSFSYTIADGSGGLAVANVFAMVVPVNDNPAAVVDAASTSEDTAVIIDLLANDSDVDGDSLSITTLSTPTLGSVADNGDGTVTYTPAADLSGTDVFSYTVSDGNGGTAGGQVTIEIIPANDAPAAVADTAVVDEDGMVTIYVLDNDEDVDGDAVQLVAVIAPANGMVTFNPDGAITYAPYPDFNGSDSFSYTISDSSGAMDTAVVSVTINPVNDAPVANNDAVGTLEDTAVTITVLENDGDIDGDTLTLSAVTAPANGIVVINPEGTLTYTPVAAYNGTDNLVYTISDGQETASAVVSITITAENDNPEAADDAVTTPEDVALTFDVLLNDIDIDGDAITVSAVTTPTNGSVTLNSDGTLTYTPTADFNGTDSLIYTVMDGSGGADTAVVTIDVTPVNDAPTAGGDSDTVNEDAAVTIAVLDNDSDKDGDSLTVTAVTAPPNGSAVINPDNTVTYTPAADYNGSDSFSYTVEDGFGGMATATVTIHVNPVNDDPLAADDMVVLNEDTVVTIAVLDNDGDLDGDSLTVTAVTAPANGAIVINPDNTITYTPDADFNGADSFGYTIEDGSGGAAQATVIIIVNQVGDTCTLFPIALNEGLLTGAQPGDILTDVMNGEQPGNFGWLTWTNDNSTPALIAGLTLPGNSDIYVNPNDPNDYIISVGDWVQGKPGVSNAIGVRDALDILMTTEIVVPVWDVTQGDGANVVYHITGFARIRILDYHLPGQDQISAEFIGFEACDG